MQHRDILQNNRPDSKREGDHLKTKQKKIHRGKSMIKKVSCKISGKFLVKI